jgi:trimethylamine corrinoid protein
MEKELVYEEAKNAIIKGDKTEAEEVAKKGISEGIDPIELLSQGFIAGINEVGERFGCGKLFLPDLILAADTMKSVTEICSSALPQDKIEKKGKIVVGTVEGDIHDIGKAIVVSLLQANGFEVHDLGRDVATQKFIDKALEMDADVIGSSCLLTTTMEGQKKLEQELRRLGLRDRFKTIIGGAPVTQRWADRIGADAYAEDAADGVKKVRGLIGSKR